MARKRSIDPSLWSDFDFNRLSSDAKILFISLICNADDDGYLLGTTDNLKVLTFPLDKISPRKMQKIIDELASIMSNVCLFESEGIPYIHLLNWEKYQKQRPERRVQSRYPKCPQHDRHKDNHNVRQEADKLAGKMSA